MKKWLQLANRGDEQANSSPKEIPSLQEGLLGARRIHVVISVIKVYYIIDGKEILVRVSATTIGYLV